MVPDLIVNPHAIPSRMTCGQLMEALYGKVCINTCREGDGTPFSELNVDEIADILEKECDMERYGKEVMYNAKTGEQMDVQIFIAPTYYQKLKHMVNDKIHSREVGPYQILTRQPQAGRASGGGLRLGEMERDCLLSHGVMAFLREKIYDTSDPFQFWVCKHCHHIAIVNEQRNIWKCQFCTNIKDFSFVQVPYASKLFLHEIMGMSIIPKLITSGAIESSSTIEEITNNTNIGVEESKSS